MSKIMNRRMNEVSDKQLVAQAKAGSVEAFSSLVERYQERIYKVIHRFTRNHEDTDDLTQETWMQAFRALKSFREEANFFTWVYRIAINLTLNHLRKQKKEKGKESLAGWKEVGQKSHELISSELSEIFDLKEKVEAILTTLPLVYRSTFILVILEGLSYRQAAALLGCSENTVAWRMYKARHLLQKKLEPYLKR